MSNLSNQENQASDKTRRQFMTTAPIIGAVAISGKSSAAGVYKSILPATVLGANEKIRTGHIGEWGGSNSVCGMGVADLVFVMKRMDMQPIAVCDMYPKNVQRMGAMARKKPGVNPTEHHDFREVIDNKDVDAVIIAMPDHWHALCTLYAADAGKAIYCELPAATTIEEGQAMVDAVRHNKVVFQGGLLQRSGPHYREAVQMIRSGYIGKVHRVETWFNDSETIAGMGPGEDDIAKYPDCDWELQQGWVEHAPFNTNRWGPSYRNFLDYSGGRLSGWGAHLLDIGLWAMELEDVKPVLQPGFVVANGGKWVIQDNRTTPDTLDVFYTFDDFTMSFSNRAWNGHRREGDNGIGTLFHGTLGSLQVSRGGYQVWATENNATDGKPTLLERTAEGSPLNEPHWQNFADCIRSGQDPVASVEVLHSTSRLCHMGTCSYVAGGEKLGWDAASQRFTGENTEAVETANGWAYRAYKNGWSLKARYWRG